MGPETRNPLGKKLDKASKREGLQKPEIEPKPTYVVVRNGSELQKALAEKIETAQILKKQIYQVGKAEPSGEQVEIIPQSPVDSGFFASLPEGREFIVYANTQDLTTTAKELENHIGQNTLVLFEADTRLLNELTHEPE